MRIAVSLVTAIAACLKIFIPATAGPTLPMARNEGSGAKWSSPLCRQNVTSNHARAAAVCSRECRSFCDTTIGNITTLVAFATPTSVWPLDVCYECVGILIHSTQKGNKNKRFKINGRKAFFSRSNIHKIKTMGANILKFRVVEVSTHIFLWRLIAIFGHQSDIELFLWRGKRLTSTKFKVVVQSLSYF